MIKKVRRTFEVEEEQSGLFTAVEARTGEVLECADPITLMQHIARDLARWSAHRWTLGRMDR